MRNSILPVFSRALRSIADKIDKRFSSGTLPGKADMILNEYVDSLPSIQNAIDSIPGWNSVLPIDAIAGKMPLYNDRRIIWATQQFGAIEGKTILELGPLEGLHTYMMNIHRPAKITAIEANRLAFLRCMVVKDLLSLDRAHFLLGNFVKWLETTEERYDLIIASGVLYHMQDPLHLLDLMATHGDAFYLWTHYASDAAMPVNDPRRQFVSDAEIRLHHGIPVRLYRRRYFGAWKDTAFCGGMYDLHSWIDRDDMIAVIRANGFDDVRVEHDEPDHPNGPSFSIFARRTRT